MYCTALFSGLSRTEHQLALSYASSCAQMYRPIAQTHRTTKSSEVHIHIVTPDPVITLPDPVPVPVEQHQPRSTAASPHQFNGQYLQCIFVWGGGGGGHCLLRAISITEVQAEEQEKSLWLRRKAFEWLLLNRAQVSP